MKALFGNLVYQYNVAALVYMVVLMWLFLKFKNFPLETNKYFGRLLICGIFTTLADLFSCYALAHYDTIPLYLNYLIQILYYIPNMLCVVFYYLMSISMTKAFQKHRLLKHRIIYVIFAVDTFFICTSPFTGLMFSINENGELVHGPLMIVRYATAIILIIVILVDVIKHQRLMTYAQRQATYTYTLATAVGVMVSFLDPSLLVINFSLSVGCLIAFMALQTPSDTKDEITDVGNLAGFKHAMNAYFRQKDQFSLICLKYESLDYYEKLFGYDAFQEMIREIANRLAVHVSKSSMYRLGRDSFVLLTTHKSDLIPGIVKSISEYGDVPIRLNGTSITVKPLICLLHAPESIAYADDVEDTIEFAFREAKNQPEKSLCFTLEEEALIRKRRDQAILRVLKRAIANNEFKVCFQPVFSPEQNKYTFAEALARLKDPALGDISPAEFIPIAEKSGLIVPIGEIIIDQVCSFIRMNIREGSPLQGISVNLSPVQCMQSDFTEKILTIIDKHQINPHYLEFELTAETMTHAAETFTPVMKTLSALGVRFTIDNYAVNMADAPLLTNIPLTTIKISKRVTDEALESDKLIPAMKNSIASLKDLGYRVIATGVETREKADQVKSFGCDYLQGFYFSAPLTEEEFSKLIASE